MFIFHTVMSDGMEGDVTLALYANVIDFPMKELRCIGNIAFG